MSADRPGPFEPHLDVGPDDAPARPFDDWRHAVAALLAAEKSGAPHADLVRLSEEVIRTRNVLALDRLAAGMPLPEVTARYLPSDERLLAEEDDTAHDNS
jgi:hypothetical protein